MNILFYAWGSHNDPAAINELNSRPDVNIVLYTKKVADFHADSIFAMEFMELIHSNSFDIVFSYNYFPIISMICEINNLPYVSWMLDCPLRTTYSKTITNDCNYLFNFDKLFNARLISLGAKHCYHMPLGGFEFFEGSNIPVRDSSGKFACDISFVGKLYNEKKYPFRQAEFSEYTKGYLDGIINAQEKIYGYNFIREVLSEDLVSEIASKCNLDLGDMFIAPLRDLASDTLGTEVSAREREDALFALASDMDVDLYTKSTIPDSLKLPGLHFRGTVDYEREMPYVFRDSKINLNITSKTIESGISLRVLDIMFCGGFCMTNYQPEIAEFFEDGADLVMYSSIEDLKSKVSYYLEHEQERAQIALNGYKKVKQNHSLGKAIDSVLKTIGKL